MSLSMYSSFLFDKFCSLDTTLSPWTPNSSEKFIFTPSNALPAEYCIAPSLFLSCQATKPICSQFLNHSGASTYLVSCSESVKLTRANAPTAGAVVKSKAIKTKA